MYGNHYLNLTSLGSFPSNLPQASGFADGLKFRVWGLGMGSC